MRVNVETHCWVMNTGYELQLTDEFLRHVVTACERLQKLDVSYNRLITAPAVQHYVVHIFLPLLVRAATLIVTSCGILCVCLSVRNFEVKYLGNQRSYGVSYYGSL